MADSGIPQSPEEYPAEVRKELDQQEVTHRGEAREGGDESLSNHMGAVENEQTPVTPPMEGPSNLIEGESDQSGIDPREELHGG